MAQHKAWTYKSAGYPDALHQSMQDTPESISGNQLKVKVKAAALNPVDVQMMNLYVWNIPGINSFEKGVGEDFAGEVLEVGSNLKDKYAKGDAVFGLHMAPGKPGTLAEMFIADVTSDIVLKKPEAWDWEHAAAIPLVWLTAESCIDQVQAYMKSEKKTLGILGGSSAVGMHVVKLAKKRNWHVIATCSDKNIDFVKSQGADEVIDYNKSSVADAMRSNSPDAIIDCVGGTDCLGISKRYVTIVGDKHSRMNMGGSLIYLWNPQMVMRWFQGKIGLGEVYDCIMLDKKEEYLREAAKLKREEILIDSTYDFDQVKEAFEKLNTSRARGKIVIKIDQ